MSTFLNVTKSCFSLACLTLSLEIKNFKRRRALLFSNENADCSLANKWKDKYLYWEVRSFDLRSEAGDDTPRPQELLADFWTNQTQSPRTYVAFEVALLATYFLLGLFFDTFLRNVG
jgi:hypothetical protein